MAALEQIVPTAGRRTTAVIEPASGWQLRRLRDFWSFRELLYFLTWRDVKVRYKQTFFGCAWALLQPFMLMVVFSIFLGHLAGMSSLVDVPYPLFAFAGLVPWLLFAQALSSSSDALVQGRELVTKVYFPRLILPIAAAGSYVFDFVIALTLVFAMMAWYGIAPSWTVVTLPGFALLAVTTAFAVGIWLSALNVRFRDVKYTIPFIVQLWLFATPVAYPASIIPEAWQPVAGLNPMAGIVTGARWALLGGTPPGAMLAVSMVATVLLLAGGIAFFQRVERTFADVI